MNLKLRLKLKDIIRLLLGKSLLVKDQYNNVIYRVQKGHDTYITKG